MYQHEFKITHQISKTISRRSELSFSFLVFTSCTLATILLSDVEKWQLQSQYISRFNCGRMELVNLCVFCCKDTWKRIHLKDTNTCRSQKAFGQALR